MNKKLTILVGIILSSSLSYAYIDPGTAGAVAGSIWPFILMILGAIGGFLAKIFWHPIKRFFTKKSDAKKNGKKTKK